MQLKSIVFLPEAHVVFTDAEIALLVECSTHHHDAACQEASQVGVLHGIQTRAKHSSGLPYPLSCSDLDLLSKVLEAGEQLSLEKAKTAMALKAEIRRTYLRLNENTAEPKTFD